MNYEKIQKIFGILFILAVLLFVNDVMSQTTEGDLCDGEEGVSYSMCKSFYKSLERYKMKTSNLPPPGEECEDICPCGSFFDAIPDSCWAGTENIPVEFVSNCDITFSQSSGIRRERVYREVYFQYRVEPSDVSKGVIFANIETRCIKDEDEDCVEWICGGDYGSENYDTECDLPPGGGSVEPLNPSELRACNCQIEKYAKELYYSGVPIIGLEGPGVLPRIRYKDELPDEAFTCQ